MRCDKQYTPVHIRALDFLYLRLFVLAIFLLSLQARNKIKNMIQTNYVALEHPYRVIYYNGVVGLQIGSLIVTTEKQDKVGGSAVEIKSHPVVSYCGAEAKKNISRISYPGVYSEAVVWDQVEQSEVTTLCSEGGSIDCDDFLCEIGQGLWKRGLKHGMMKSADTAFRLQKALQRFGVGISSLPSQDQFSGFDVELSTWEKNGVQMCGRPIGDWFSFEAPIDKDEEKTVKALMEQFDFWHTMVSVCSQLAGFDRKLSINFIPYEDTHILGRLTSRLNREQEKRFAFLDGNND